MPRAAGPHRLSKSRFVAGLQCPKLLWWRVHEPDAPELVPDAALQALFDQGEEVGRLARERVPGGVLIPRTTGGLDAAVAATAEALGEGERVIYEAAFLADDVFVAVDVLERRGTTWRLVEVKSSTAVREHHLPDVAVQLHVLRRSGLDVRAAEVMTLSRACVHPDLARLFARTDVTTEVEARLDDVAARIPRQLEVLAAPLPDVPVGPQCVTPYPCPFHARCHAPRPPDHVDTLHQGREKARALLAAGTTRLADIPRSVRLTRVQARQVRAAREGRMIVERGLAAALDAVEGPFGYLDFETVNPAVPRWPGTRPFDPVPVQFVHVARHPDGRTETTTWLARGADDPRPALAERLLEATAASRSIFAWHAAFERACIQHLARTVPRHADALRDLAARLVDLLPITRDHVYHPAFEGSFRLKRVLPALVPELAYDDLEIRDGATATLTLQRLLLHPESLTPVQRRDLPAALEAYCRRDAEGLVRLHDRLLGLAREG